MEYVSREYDARLTRSVHFGDPLRNVRVGRRRPQLEFVDIYREQTGREIVEAAHMELVRLHCYSPRTTQMDLSLRLGVSLRRPAMATVVG